VAGIAIAALVGVAILAAVLFFFIRRQRQKTAYKASLPETDVSVLSGPVHNAPPPPPPESSDDSAPQTRFWSPEAILNSVSDSNYGHSSGSGGNGNHEQSVDENGMELDGDGTQIQPVYHELDGSEVGK
jgi:hypothetical protein